MSFYSWKCLIALSKCFISCQIDPPYLRGVFDCFRFVDPSSERDVQHPLENWHAWVSVLMSSMRISEFISFRMSIRALPSYACTAGERLGCLLCELGTTGTEWGYKKGKGLLALHINSWPHLKAMTTTVVLEWMVALFAINYWGLLSYHFSGFHFFC